MDLDSKLTGILARLTNSDNAAGTDESTMQGSKARSSSSVDVNKTPSGSTSSGQPALASNSNGHSTLSADIDCDGGLNYPTTIEDTWSPNIDMNHDLLDHLLEQFRSIQSYFPFVVISADCSAAKMIAERPFLLLAAITSVTSKYPRLQATLAEELRRTLASRTIVSSDNDLDLLQGLLVHLAW